MADLKKTNQDTEAVVVLMRVQQRVEFDGIDLSRRPYSMCHRSRSATHSWTLGAVRREGAPASTSSSLIALSSAPLRQRAEAASMVLTSGCIMPARFVETDEGIA